MAASTGARAPRPVLAAASPLAGRTYVFLIGVRNSDERRFCEIEAEQGRGALLNRVRPSVEDSVQTESIVVSAEVGHCPDPLYCHTLNA